MLAPAGARGESPFELPDAMRAENRHDGRRQANRAAAAFGLRFDEAPTFSEAFERVADAQHAAIEIQIRPP